MPFIITEKGDHMAEYLCKCCGAPLDVKGRVTVCKCANCDVMQSIPRLDFDEKAILWERADKLRRAGEYDRAAELYRELLKLDDSDSEIYWCIMLCRYGIEYVEEYGSRKRTPTINRFSYTPIINDEDYRAAVRVADGDRRRVYILQAGELEELRKKVLAVSQTEQPYDIFICYKESDRSGRRTEDSVLAAGLYRSLSADGYRVFFARVTLEDKTGREYEPYIFSAINSARLMFAVGTSPDNFNAPWVKNEWSRYLTRVSESGEGTLAVLYKGMRSEDLPAEFAHLQRFDMSAPDFTDELLRGVHKIFSGESRGERDETEEAYITENASGLLRRAEIMLDEGDFSRAEELCENALNIEPENARIYFVKLLAGFRVKSAERLGELSGDLEQSSNYRMIMRFGDDELKAELSEYRKSAFYNMCMNALERADTEELCLKASDNFQTLGDYRNSPEMSRKCLEKAEKVKRELQDAENERVYVQAKKLLDGETYVELSRAMDLFSEIRGYKDSAELFAGAHNTIAEMDREREEAARQAAELERQKREKLNKLRKNAVKAAMIALPAALAVSITAVTAVNITRSNKYKIAVEMRENGDFDGAAEAFSALGTYSDSETQFTETLYQKATTLYEQEDYEAAERAFTMLGNYSQSAEYARRSWYAIAETALENGEFDRAVSIYEMLGNYSDSAENILKAKYQKAEALKADGKFNQAAELFRTLGEYSDSGERANECKYCYAEAYFEDKKYDQAHTVFSLLGDYSDSAQRATESRYLFAMQLLDNGNTVQASDIFVELGDYKDSKEQARKVKLAKVETLKNDKQFEYALDLLENLGYSETDELFIETKYDYALYLIDEVEYYHALVILEELDENYKQVSENTKYAKYMLACSYMNDADDNFLLGWAENYFEELGDYLDSEEKLVEIDHLRYVNVDVGEIISFGKFKQNITLDPVKWKVLTRIGTRVLVVSEKVLDCHEYGGETWKDSTIRSYLNGEFFNTAFTSEEQAMIPTVTVKNPDNETYGTYGGGDTEDKIFLLSLNEVKRYIADGNQTPDHEARRAEGTSWALEKYDELMPPNTFYTKYDTMLWWLRDPAEKSCHMYVTILGNLNTEGARIGFDRGGVRPAMWIDLGE